MLLKSLPRKLLRDGAYADFNDSQGYVWHDGLEFIFAVLWRANPVDQQLETIKVAVQFFQFCPYQGKPFDSVIYRFDMMVARANLYCGLDISYVFGLGSYL